MSFLTNLPSPKGLYTLTHMDVQRIVFKFEKKPKVMSVHHIVFTKGPHMYGFLFENGKCTSYPPVMPELRGQTKSSVTSNFRKQGYAVSISSFTV